MSQKKNITPIVNPKVWNYNGYSFELDMTDADVLERYEAIFDEMGEREKELPKTGKASEIIRAQYNWFVEMFDKIFGEGTGVQICGEKPSLFNCYDAYDSFLLFVASQKDARSQRVANISSTYLNRAQRRAKKATK